MMITLIAATDLDGLIGSAGGLPWRIPADLRHFKRRTMGRPVVMGRKTYEPIGRPLRGRKNIILTRNEKFAADGCVVAHTVSECLKAAEPEDELMIAGGAAVYALFLPLADRFELTLVHGRFSGDTYFPHWTEAEWRQLARTDHPADDRNPHPYSFVTLERIERPSQSARADSCL